jgi:hypothetical protein
VTTNPDSGSEEEEPVAVDEGEQEAARRSPAAATANLERRTGMLDSLSFAF